MEQNVIVNQIETDDPNMNKKAHAKLITLRVLAYIFLIFLAVLSLFFFWLLFVQATMTNAEIIAGKLTVIPSTSFFDNLNNLLYGDLSSNFNLGVGLRNSFIISLGSSILTCYFSALTAYGIYAYDFKLKKVAEAFILAVMMIPSQLSSVGFIQLAYKMNLTGQMWVLIVPSIAAPATFFYMIQYLRATLPKDLIEASRMDGSSEFGTFNRIVLPIMKPAIAVQFIFSFVGSWNNLYMPALLLSDYDDTKTLPVMISSLNSQMWGTKDLGAIYVAIFLSILPVIVVYIFLSKFIIKGVTSGSVKG